MYRFRDMEITFREVLFSIIIIIVMLIIGIVIHSNISDSLMSKYQRYNTALQIDNNEKEFAYAIYTDVGDVIAYGELKAVDTVTYPEIDGDYSYVCMITEKHRMHTRTYTTTDSNGHTHVHTETYWSWDEIDRKSIHSNNITFLNKKFEYKEIKLPDDVYLCTKDVNIDTRHVYYVRYPSYTGTLLTTIKDNQIYNSVFYNNKNIEETLKYLESGYQLIIFWILWIILIIIVILGFYYIDNNWLEG